MTVALEAQSLYRFYHAGDEETLALRGVSMAVEAGEMVAVTGPSGSGKSTLLACLAGLDEPDGGTVRIAGERLSRRPEQVRTRLRGASIGMLYQSANLIGHLSVEQNVALARRLGRGRGAAGHAGHAGTVLERVGIAHRSRARPSELSGGEQARAGLAVALANEPLVLLADEPTGELDSVSARAVVELLRERTRDGAGVVLVTHDPDVAARADREIRLRDGRVEP